MHASKTAFQILEVYTLSEDVLGNKSVLTRVNFALNIYNKMYYFLSLDYIHDIGDRETTQAQAEYLLIGLAGLQETFESKIGFESIEDLVDHVLS